MQLSSEIAVYQCTVIIFSCLQNANIHLGKIMFPRQKQCISSLSWTQIWMRRQHCTSLRLSLGSPCCPRWRSQHRTRREVWQYPNATNCKLSTVGFVHPAPERQMSLTQTRQTRHGVNSIIGYLILNIGVGAVCEEEAGDIIVPFQARNPQWG